MLSPACPQRLVPEKALAPVQGSGAGGEALPSPSDTAAVRGAASHNEDFITETGEEILAGMHW